MNAPLTRTIRDRRSGLVVVSVYPRPYDGSSWRAFEFHLHWEQGTALLTFGISNRAEVSHWTAWPPDMRDFALCRLGMTHLHEKVLREIRDQDRHQFVLTTQHDDYFSAVQAQGETLAFSDYAEESIDRRIRDDICFALGERGFVRGKRVSLRQFPFDLLSSFWTPQEMERNIRNMEADGLVEVQFLDGQVVHGLALRPVEALGLSREGEKKARDLAPRKKVLFEEAEQVQEDTELMRLEAFRRRTADKGGVFVSYSHADQDIARMITERFGEDGIEYWIDDKDLLVGQVIDRAISEGIQTNYLFLIVLTPHSVKSTWVQRELDEASHEEAEGRKIVLPVIAKNLSPEAVPERLRRKFYADLSQDFEAGYAKLKKAILLYLSSNLQSAVNEAPATSPDDSRRAGALATGMPTPEECGRRILAIFAEDNRRPGEMMTFPALSTRWFDRGGRGDDLKRGLEWLLAMAYVEAGERGLCYFLTEAGFREMNVG